MLRATYVVSIAPGNFDCNTAIPPAKAVIAAPNTLLNIFLSRFTVSADCPALANAFVVVDFVETSRSISARLRSALILVSTTELARITWSAITLRGVVFVKAAYAMNTRIGTAFCSLLFTFLPAVSLWAMAQNVASVYGTNTAILTRVRQAQIILNNVFRVRYHTRSSIKNQEQNRH